MTQAIKAGDTIRVAYTGKFENGDVFDASEKGAPLEFTVGEGRVIQGFDEAVVGMREGEKKTINVSPDEGYGIRNDDHMFDIPNKDISEDMALTVGKAIQVTNKSGQKIPGIISSIGDTAVTIDANHPLAGKNLIFDIEVVETVLEAGGPG
jgi:peptidylprolyl isomerase